MQYVIVGCGYTGGRVLKALGPARAIGLSRTRPDGAPAHLETLDLDTSHPLPSPLPRRYALLYTVPPNRDVETDPRLPRLLSLLDPRPSRLVYTSTSGVYGDCDGRLVDEATTPRPVTARAKRRLVAERQLAEWAGLRDVGLVILRVPGIYGPGRLGLDRLRAASPVIRESEAHPGNRIHVDDLSACCIRALGGDRPTGIYNVSDGDHRSQTWFATCVARLAGLSAPPTVTRAEAGRQFPAARLSFLGESRRLDNSRMRDVLGVEPRYADAEDGIRATLRAEGFLAG